MDKAKTKRTSDFFKFVGEKMSDRALLMIIAAVLGGGGSFAVLDYVSKDEMKDVFKNITNRENDRHAKIDVILETQTDDIVEIKGSLKNIQQTLNQQVARQEALRVLEHANVKGRKAIFETYNRVYDLNMARLEKGLEPCQSLTCSN